MKKSRWTIIDTLITVVVVAVVAVAAIKFLPGMLGSGETGKVRFTVLISNREPGFSEAFKEGEKVTLSLTEKDGGIIKSVRHTEATQMVYNSMTGEYSNVTNPDKEDVEIDVEADCTVDDYSIKTGDTAIKIGVDIPVRGKGFATSGYIIGIENIESEEAQNNG